MELTMCKPKVKKFNGFLKLILSEDIIGITLAPFGIYLNDIHLTDKETINHESIHWKQQLEMLIIFFYLWYGIEWFIRLFINGRYEAYYMLSFEREAYENDANLDYLKKRKHFSWFKYINKK